MRFGTTWLFVDRVCFLFILCRLYSYKNMNPVKAELVNEPKR